MLKEICKLASRLITMYTPGGRWSPAIALTPDLESQLEEIFRQHRELPPTPLRPTSFVKAAPLFYHLYMAIRGIKKTNRITSLLNDFENLFGSKMKSALEIRAQLMSLLVYMLSPRIKMVEECLLTVSTTSRANLNLKTLGDIVWHLSRTGWMVRRTIGWLAFKFIDAVRMYKEDRNRRGSVSPLHAICCAYSNVLISSGVTAIDYMDSIYLEKLVLTHKNDRSPSRDNAPLSNITLVALPPLFLLTFIARGVRGYNRRDIYECYELCKAIAKIYDYAFEVVDEHVYKGAPIDKLVYKLLDILKTDIDIGRLVRLVLTSSSSPKFIISVDRLIGVVATIGHGLYWNIDLEALYQRREVVEASRE